ncbi:MAG: 16S rRNA processing protein RimM [Anaerolineales bacterium]|nr:16S rRNA processing protein RimM [Anaerolineales bacterium]
MTADPNPSSLNPAGSPSGEPVFLVVGQLGKPHGVRGEVSMTILTEFPERILPGKTLYLGEEYRPMRVRQARGTGTKLLLALAGIETRTQAEELRNEMVYVLRAEVPPLPEGEYYYHQLLGLNVISEDGQDLGHLEEILPTGANDVYLIRLPDGRELLLPIIPGVLLGVDLSNQQMQVHVLPGSMP